MNLLPIKLGKLRLSDYEVVLNWSKDDDFCLANGWEQNRNEAELYKWWLHCVNNESKEFVRRAIFLDDQFIGYADLAAIENTKAELGIAIGESKLWGKGIGTKSIICMMQYATEQFGITTFGAETHEGNIRSRRMLEKVGFKEISRIGKEQYLGTENQLIQYRLELGC